MSWSCSSVTVNELDFIFDLGSFSVPDFPDLDFIRCFNFKDFSGKKGLIICAATFFDR